MNCLEYKSECVGCSSCSSICPKNAIKMELNQEGFLYPTVDETACIDCSLCVKHCPVTDNNEHNDSLKMAYYGWNTEGEIRFRSSSGGIFSGLAKSILDKDGIVFGAVFDGENFVYSDTSVCGLDLLRKSKYTEIDPMESFNNVKNYLNSGKWVLFCGTPCRVAGLKFFLEKDYEKLVLVDFICGGVASPALLKDDFDYLEKKYKRKIVDVDFRSKKYGWGGQHALSLKFDKGTNKTILAMEDAYFTGFLLKYINRKSCYNCNFVDSHYSDITIGDFWDYKKIPDLSNDRKGMSVCVVHTRAGEDIIKYAKKYLVLTPIDYNIVSGNFKNNGNLASKICRRDAFFSKTQKQGFISASKEYMDKKRIAMYKFKNFFRQIMFKIGIEV